jgi:hypothetical protein
MTMKVKPADSRSLLLVGLVLLIAAAGLFCGFARVIECPQCTFFRGHSRIWRKTEQWSGQPVPLPDCPRCSNRNSVTVLNRLLSKH